MSTNLDQYQSNSEAQVFDRLFGRDWVCSGGPARLLPILDRIELGPRKRVLDIGSGRGGAAFTLASKTGATVNGIDLTEAFVASATARCRDLGLTDQVEFFRGDILDARRFDAACNGPYDLVTSIDCFLHIHDKVRLFGTIGDLLAPGGRLVFQDYCVGEDAGDMYAYAEQFGYHLLRVPDYVDLLHRAGFEVSWRDLSPALTEHTRENLKTARREGFDWWWDVFERRLDRLEKGQHRLTLFDCAPA